MLWGEQEAHKHYSHTVRAAVVVNEDFMKCKTVKAVDELLDSLRSKYSHAESAGSDRGFRPDQIEAAAIELQEDKKGGKTLRGNHLKKPDWYKV